jgi:excinuclease ABC subunit C
MSVDVIKQALEHLPQSPGVYLMKDAAGKVIYVGKAKRLKSRVANYARQEPSPTYYRHKVEAMVEKAVSLEFVVTSSEKEALLLENTLIKRHRPFFNVDLRDDKTYPYFRLSLQHDYPRLSLVRRPVSDGARYYGPFESAGAARKTLRWLQRIFPLRRCSDHALKNRTRPCLDFETGRCPAPCTGKISQADYQKLGKQLERFFAGQGMEVAGDLERQMKRAAAAEHFEEAAILRDRWQALTRTLERQNVAKAEGLDLDAVALHDEGSAYRLAVIVVRGGRVVASRVHDLSQAALEPEEVMGQALLMLYEKGAPPPPLLLVSHMPGDPALVVEVLGDLAGRKVEVRKPQRGEKREVLELAKMNAAQPRAAAGDQSQVLERLAKKLSLRTPPRHIECVDISHISGQLTVASIVAMADAKLDKHSYRRYKVIGTGGQPDDFAAMAEVVERRLSGDREPPDLLLLDGGKGQLGAVMRILSDLPPEKRPALAALAKGRGKGPDKVYLPGRKNPVNLKARDPELLLLMRLRDEAHRFAITYHRLLRKKALTRSILDEVPGVGPSKRRRLLRAFGSLAKLKTAGAAEMVAQAGVDAATAHRVEAFLAALDTAQPPK